MHRKELQIGDIPELLELAQKKSWWVRRIAMLHQLGWRDRVHSARLFSYALAFIWRRILYSESHRLGLAGLCVTRSGSSPGIFKRGVRTIAGIKLPQSLQPLKN